MIDRPLSFSDFDARVGQSFTMRFATRPEADDLDGSCEVELAECVRSTVPGMSRSFNLLFRAGPDAPREQGLYLLSREDFEPAPIFLVPVRALADGLEFHAVFNPIDGG
jgi:Domain of unknown function (DUF6916)